MKAGNISLGCAKNLVDTEVMLGLLRENGVELTKKPREADVLIVNTCAFIETAKQESITTVLTTDLRIVPNTYQLMSGILRENYVCLKG